MLAYFSPSSALLRHKRHNRKQPESSFDITNNITQTHSVVLVLPCPSTFGPEATKTHNTIDFAQRVAVSWRSTVTS
jgi:hypothetical protein